MWHSIASIILRNRLAILMGLLLVTLFMGYESRKVRLQYEFGNLLPESDSTQQEYLNFKKQFGQDGLIIVLATEVNDFYTKDKFSKWHELGNAIKTLQIPIKGSNPPEYVSAVDSVFSEAHAYNIVKNTGEKIFELKPVLDGVLLSQKKVDSLKNVIHSLPFYRNMIYKDTSDLHVMMVFVNAEVFNSRNRGNLVENIKGIADQYTADFGVIRYSGLPYIRSVTMNSVQRELYLFVFLAIVVTALVLFLFYRSLKVVLVSLFVVCVGVIWGIGIIGWIGYEINIMMGLLPPLIIVIGIPNCVYLITKYQQEYLLHGNKAKALTRVIKKVGNATFLTNVTTALGFGAFLLTKSDMMREFGLVASISIISLFLISILIVTIFYSYLPPPKQKHTKHLDKKWLDKIVGMLLNLSTSNRKWVYIVSVLVVISGVYGISLIKTSGNISDDLPKDGEVVQDLKFFEQEFGGVMPFEIILRSNDTIYTSYRNLKMIDTIQSILSHERLLSRSISIVDAIKYVSQAYSNGAPEKYVLRDEAGLQKMMQSKYFKNTFDLASKNSSSRFIAGFVDDKHHQSRITVQIADIGIDTMDALLNRVKSKVNAIVHAEENLVQRALSSSTAIRDSILNDLYTFYPWVLRNVEDSLIALDETLEFSFLEDENLIFSFHNNKNFNDILTSIVSKNTIGYTVTGAGVVYTKGTTYLVDNLITSLLTAIAVIAVLMSFLFKSWRMVLVSLVPNLIPLLFTSGLMGYLGVPIKPSTLLVFSIAFGISVDDTIHFLAKYRQELKAQSWNIRGSVLNAIRETGVSMIYTSIILFFGFSIFIASSFGGTQALGILVSVTLFVAMLANLVLLPSLLLTLERYATTKAFRSSLLEMDDDDIELGQLEMQKNKPNVKP